MRRGYVKAFAAAFAALCMASCASSEPGSGTGRARQIPSPAPALTAPVRTLSDADECSYTAPEYFNGSKTPQLFDTAPIVYAYRSGDSSVLTQLEKDILSRAEEIVGSVIKDGMTDYEKELALHDYIVTHCEYDMGTLAAVPTPAEHNSDPYGALIVGKAICSGYTTAFRLLMDMVGVPCETVYSASDLEDDHAWNLVTINGGKYFVDVTWDDPILPEYHGRFACHRYFNVTGGFLAETHDIPSVCPAVEAYDDSYTMHEISPMPETDEELAAIIRSKFAQQKEEIIFIPAEDSEWLKKLATDPYAGYFFDLEFLKNIEEICRQEGCAYAGDVRLVPAKDGEALVFCIKEI